MSAVFVRWIWRVCGVLVTTVAGTVSAGVVTDGTVGPRVRLDGDFEIGADLGRQAGHNLFHSCERFSLATGERATFSGPADIRNLISRVTGGARSDIDGTIASTIPGAAFYFLNPAGVLFGATASLDVQGSFHVSTADELRFADGAVFSAGQPTASSFSVAAPEAFGFVGARDPAQILVHQSVLEVPIGESFSLIGGDIMIQGDPDAEDRGGPETVRAEAGQITLAAVGGRGEAQFGSGVIDAVRKADISLIDQAAVHTGADGGGTIRIRGGDFMMRDASVVSATNNGASDEVGGIDIDADRVRLTRSGIGASTVRVTTGDLTVVDGSGFGGDDVVIAAGNDIIVSDGSGISANDRVTIRASNLLIEKQSNISSDAEFRSNGGDVIVTATQDLILRDGRISSGTVAEGRGGGVIVMAGNLTVGKLGLIATDTFGEGAAGELTVMADNLIVREGEISSRSLDTGDAGKLTITANNILVEEGGLIDSLVSGGFDSVGNGGDVVIKARNHLSLRNGGSISADNLANGNAGSIEIEASSIKIQDFGRISSSSIGSGVSGTIRIEGAIRIELDDGARISTISGSSGGGDIEMEVRDLLLLRSGSRIDADVLFGGARAGDISIDPRFLVLDASVIAATADAGSGGRIEIDADHLIVSPGSEITARAGPAGISGTVVVSSPEVDLSGGLVVLEGALLNAASQLRERCGARRDIGASSFTGVGRGGLPPSPDGPLAGVYSSQVGAPALALAAPRGQKEASVEEHSASRANWPAIATLAPCHGAL